MLKLNCFLDSRSISKKLNIINILFYRDYLLKNKRIKANKILLLRQIIKKNKVSIKSYFKHFLLEMSKKQTQLQIIKLQHKKILLKVDMHQSFSLQLHNKMLFILSMRMLHIFQIYMNILNNSNFSHRMLELDQKKLSYLMKH